MNILESTIKQNLVDNYYSKSPIKVGNYYLKWNEEKISGIQHNEIPEIRKFLNNAIPFFDACYWVLHNLETLKCKNKYRKDKQLFPGVCLSHKNKHHEISYELHMTSGGTTILDRIEKINFISKNIDNISSNTMGSEAVAKREHSIKGTTIHLKWNLGEILFNRHGSDSTIKG
jgi:hypothetical protein